MIRLGQLMPDPSVRVLDSDAKINLLITDVGLPGEMDGKQTVETARLRRPDMKVLFITAYAENAAISNGYLDAGMHVLSKPFPIAELAIRVKAIMEGS